MIATLEALKNFKIVHTIITLFVVGMYGIGSLTANPGVENLKDITLIVITFWFSSDSVERTIKSFQSIGIQKS